MIELTEWSEKYSAGTIIARNTSSSVMGAAMRLRSTIRRRSAMFAALFEMTKFQKIGLVTTQGFFANLLYSAVNTSISERLSVLLSRIPEGDSSKNSDMRQ